MTIPKYGFAPGGNLYVEGGGVRIDLPSSKNKEAIITTGGKRYVSGGTGEQARNQRIAAQQAAQKAAARQAVVRQAAAQKAAAQKAAAQKAAAQKAAQEAAAKQAAAKYQAKLQNIKGAAELKRINVERQNILDTGGTTTTKTARDVDTGRDVQLTTVQGRGGRRVFEKKDTVTGETSIVSYDVPKGGGSSRVTGGYTQTEVKQETLSEQPIVDSSTLVSPSVSAALPKSQQTDIYSQSYWTSTKQSAGNIFSNVKTFFTGRDHKYKDVLAPFDYAGTAKSEQIAVKGLNLTYTIPKFGTIAPGESGFETKTINREEKTYRQVQAEIENARVLYPNETFQDVPYFYTRSGSKVRTIVPAVADIGIATGLSIAATPLAGSGYLAFRGVQFAAKGQYKDIRSGTELYSGIVTETKTNRFGIPYTVTTGLSPESKQAGLYLGFAAIGAIGEPGRIAKELDVLRYKAAINTPTKTVGKLYNINDEKWLKTVSRKQTPYYKEQTSIDVPLFMKGKGKFNIGVGQGEQSAKFLPFSEQIGDKGWQTASQSFVTAGKGTVNPVLLNDILLPPKYAVTTGEGYFTLKDTRATKSFGFGGVTKDVGKAYTGKGGKITAQRVYGEVSDNILITPTELVIPLKSSAVVKASDTSIIFKELPKIADDFGLTVTKDVGRKSSSSFLSQLYKQEAATDVGSFASSVSSGVSGTSQVVQPAGVSLIIPPIIPRLSNEVKYKQFQQPQQEILLLNKPSSAAAVKQTPTVRVTPMVIQIPRSSNRLSSKNKSITRQVPKLKTLTKNIVAQQTGQLTKQKQLTQQKQIFGGAFHFPIRTPFTPTPTPPPISPPIIIPRLSTAKKSTKSFGGFQVFGRRFGKFKPIGVGRTEREAFSLGKKFASGTLGATFKIPKSKIFKLPGYRTKKTKEGTLFIEPRKRRLKRGTKEIPEIQFFKRLKGGNKR